MNIFAQRGADRMRWLYQGISAQPSWIIRLALLAFAVVLAIPIFMVLLIAFIAALAVFCVLVGVNAIRHRVRMWLPRSDGRANVRVIQRAD